MRLIDADAFDKCLVGAEIEATKSQKYVFSSAINTIRGNLVSFPTVNQWIPVSERLPENKSYVLTTIYIPGRQPHARSGWFENGLFMNDNGDTWKSTDREVCAWLPLPEPWREEK
jgi:hypothetical protein